MAVTPSDIKTLFPEFASVSADRIQAWIDIAECRINREAWGSKADIGVKFLTAHFTKFGESSGALGAGPVTSISVGELSKSFATPGSLSESAFGSTSYGREFLELRAEIFADRCL